MADTIDVEVAYAEPAHQFVETLSVPVGATVADALSLSRKLRRHVETADDLVCGVWGQPCERDRVLQAGDRVELYRPLEIDPREARRRLAQAGLTMNAPRNTDEVG